MRRLPIETGGSAAEAAWLDDEQLVLNSSETLHLPHGLWTLNLARGSRVPATREFANFFGISLAADRRSGVSTRTEIRSDLWVGDALGRIGSQVIPDSLFGPRNAAIDTAGSIVYSAYTGNRARALYRRAPGASRPAFLRDDLQGTFVSTADGRFVDAIPEFATTADGRFIVFSGGPESGLYRINSDGTALLTLVARNAGGPIITPDGSLVLFSPYGVPGLYSVPIDGGAIRELSKVFVGSASSISPDGRHLLFASGKPGVQMLCDLPGCTHMREVLVRSARFAPDGKGVAYVDDEDRANIWEQPLDGRPRYPLTRFATGQILQFAWSADYKRLVLSRGRVSDDIVLLKGLR